ncbi:AFR463Cp [Eremothecium gossypii ATCC 10895]|uniref:Large ribosomal subunit protein mL40 n=1 Tax=Eremothecium gossypii (strain ATCC 10895 / CBS 109.51 / FGSC 9923 / NRRL Y-1056) TaxID=284811 RepID=Q752W0_EREGS|nr:mitochondrial 54S ribosomal protein YmL28 [Eremothecium gossypii ATCC 10895]AAS53834.1 AFR463Cp [Eremothecium gossypii ATCC 10895]AEY98146.1 FAFR463Cp [Eremothecium gossypii FDAG1]
MHIVPRPSTSFGAPLRAFVRGKRTKAGSGLSPAAQRAATQLAVMTARKKQPRLLRLSPEDLVRHQTIQACWNDYQKTAREARSAQLREQYASVAAAMAELERLDAGLFRAASAPESGKRFPLELRVPTDFPPTKLWHYEFKN